MQELKTEIYLPITIAKYKKAKIALLKTNMKTINTINRINKIKEIKKAKYEQKKLLLKTINETKKDYKKILKLLPKEKEIKNKIYATKQKTNKEQKIHGKSKIDIELEKIQEKLRTLKI